MMANHDRVQVALDAMQSVREKSPEGHLRITRCVLSSACVCPYYGREIPGWETLGLQPDTIYQLYRDPTSLAQAAATMDGKPVLFRHKPVSADDHPKEITVGGVSATRWEDPDLIGSFTVWDQEAIDAIESGDLKAVSAGYAYRAIAQGGVHDGQPYSLTMVDIVFNHLALVSVPRVPNAVIGDQNTTTEAALATKTPARNKDFRAKLLASVRPFLAQDADATKLEKALDDLEEATPVPPGGAIPGKGDPKEGSAKDASPEELAEILRNSGLTDDQIALCCAALAPPGLDEGEEAARRNEAVGAEKADIEKKLKDAGLSDEQIAAALAAKPSGSTPPAMDQGISVQAMDAAIAQAVRKAEQATIQRVNALHTAREAVRPYVGEVSGMDSAAGVYGFALKEAGYDVKGLDEATLCQIWKTHTKMQDAAQKPVAHIAQDSGETASFRDEYGLGRIGVKA